eukprot:1970516-Amphidinium_carterae.1
MQWSCSEREIKHAALVPTSFKFVVSKSYHSCCVLLHSARHRNSEQSVVISDLHIALSSCF